MKHLTLILTLLIPQMAAARIGETEGECDKRYGRLFQTIPPDQSRTYRKNDIWIKCFFDPGGKCSLIQYSPVGSIELAKKIWETNHPKWKSVGSSNTHILKAESVQVDGYEDMLLWYDKARGGVLKIYSKAYHESHPNLDDSNIRSRLLAEGINNDNVNSHYGDYLKREFAYSAYDKVEGIRWYVVDHSKYFPYLTLYIGVPDKGKPFLRLKLHYCGDDWLFIDKYKIKIGDNDAITLTPPRDPKRTNDGGKVWEVFDELAGPYSHIINRIIHADDVIIRMDGSEGHYDLELTWRDRDKFKKMILLYRHLGGKWSTKGSE